MRPVGRRELGVTHLAQIGGSGWRIRRRDHGTMHEKVSKEGLAARSPPPSVARCPQTVWMCGSLMSASSFQRPALGTFGSSGVGMGALDGAPEL